MKLSAGDALVGIRTDLNTAHSITVLCVNTTNPSDTFSGAATVLNPLDTATYNHAYPFAMGDTSAVGTFHVFTTVVEADTTTVTTYPPVKLEILPKA